MSQLSPASSSSALLEEATSTAAGAQRRLADLRSFQIPRLEGCKSLGIHAELCEELRGDLEHVRRSVETCAELCEYISPRGRDEFEHTLTALTQEYKELQTAYRNAVVLSKSLINSRARSKRHLTNRDSTGDTLESEEPDKPRPAAGTDDALQTKTNEVTDALRRTTNLMQAELERSVHSVQMLDSSTQTLKLTSGLYDNYSSLLQTSTQLIRLIEKADWYDRLIILSAFVLFLLVVGWILKRRVLDKLVGGVGWWVGGSFRLLGMGMGLGSSKTSKVKGASSLASAAVSSVGPAASAALVSAANRRKVPLEGLDQKKDLNQDQGLSLEESQKARSTSTGQPHEDLVPSPPEDSAVRPAGDGAPRDEL